GKLRKEHTSLMGGSFRILQEDEAVFAFERAAGGHSLLTMLNRSLGPQPLPEGWEKAKPIFGRAKDGALAAQEVLVLLK
ncbi:MAG TPA: hypothetical protein PLU82_02250, partial [Oscillospiraceae bacterium]|nr:hypothetical protein [Oscillospiraceae bacterium]